MSKRKRRASPKAKNLKAWKQDIASKWSKVLIENTISEMPSRNLKVGSKFEVKTIVNLGDIAPTVLQLMGLKKPDEMTGTSLITQ